MEGRRHSFLERFVGEDAPMRGRPGVRSLVFWYPVSETITPFQSKTRGGELGTDPRFQNRERHPASTVCLENAGTRSEGVGEALNESESIAL
jgi:hypothetical protein